MFIVMDKLKLTVVGPGLIGKKHIELIAKNTDCELSAIVAPDTQDNQAVALEARVPFFSDLATMFDCTAVDGVIIASPNNFHVEQASECIKRDIPVLVEKPISHDYITGLKLKRLVEQFNGRLLVGHHRTYSPIIQVAQNIIQDGLLGQIVMITGSALFYKPDHYFIDGPWRTQPGGGPILINLIHEIGNYRALCGEITSVQAITSNQIRGHVVEDSAVINFRFSSGVLGTFALSDSVASSKSWEMTSGENQSYPHYPKDDCYFICGTNGMLAVPSMRIQYFRLNDEKSWWQPLHEKQIEYLRLDPLEEQLKHFLQVIRGLEKPKVSAYDGLQNLKIIEAIYSSAKTGMTIEV
jgi:predicted dehydrogenase